jgi:hypothetical protein
MSNPEILPDLPDTQDHNGRAIVIGTVVRSHDFCGMEDLDGDRASYIEGVVVGVSRVGWDCPRYVIEGTRRIFGGEETDVDSHYFPPLNGTEGIFGSMHGVVVA